MGQTNPIKHHDTRVEKFTQGITRCKICGRADITIEGTTYSCQCGFRGVVK